MHPTLSLLLLLLLPVALFAQDRPTQSIAQPLPGAAVTEMTFDERTYDFGTIEEGTLVTHVFTFTNTGDEPLLLTDARGSCGCTVPEFPRGAIAPGETASLTVQFNSKNKRGQRNQKVTLTGNTDPAQTFIYLTGMVEEGENLVLTPDAEVEQPIAKDCFAIYPNPTAEVLKLRMTDENFGKSAHVVILALSGQRMAERTTPSIAGDLEFDVSHYPAGTYHARVSVNGAAPQSQCFVVIGN